MLTLYIYKPAQIDGRPDDFITSFSAETNRECDDEPNDDKGTTCDCCGDWFHDEVGDGWCGCGNV